MLYTGEILYLLLRPLLPVIGGGFHNIKAQPLGEAAHVKILPDIKVVQDRVGWGHTPLHTP